MKVGLTHGGLSRLGYNKDFKLDMGDTEEVILCSKSQISFLSPTISKLLITDPTINEFALMTPNSSQCSDILRSLLSGSSVYINQNMKETFYSIMLELGNEEVLQNIEEELTLENVLEIVQIKYLKSMNIEREISFIASHFIELKKEEMSLLDATIIDSILGCESLVVESEHSLFDFIKDLISVYGTEYQFLLCHLRLEYLETKELAYVSSLINDDNIGCFLPRLLDRLILPLNEVSSFNQRYMKNEEVIQYRNDNFDGIFSRLWHEAGGNPISKGLVSIEETTNRTPHRVSFLIDPEARKRTDWYCGTEDDKNGSFIIDFKDKKVHLSGYSLMSGSPLWIDFMNAWKIEGSDDKESWKVIDSQKTRDLQSFMAEKYYDCKPSRPFRFFRIMMTEKTTRDFYFMGLHAIEFFGTLYN